MLMEFSCKWSAHKKTAYFKMLTAFILLRSILKTFEWYKIIWKFKVILVIQTFHGNSSEEDAADNVAYDVSLSIPVDSLSSLNERIWSPMMFIVSFFPKSSECWLDNNSWWHCQWHHFQFVMSSSQSSASCCW